MKPKILISDRINDKGIEILNKVSDTDIITGLNEEDLIKKIPAYDALIVRSETKVTKAIIDSGSNLKVIGRAGVGVDNIDIQSATSKGIAVVNSPTGNTIAAAEHAFALMLSLSRRIPEANQTMKEGKWNRSSFMGAQIQDKTLGVIGLGKVGVEVVKRANAFGMKILGYDPYISNELANSLSVNLVELDEIYKNSDFITLHIPLLESTKGLIGLNELKKMKPTTQIINAARGGLIDEDALYEALANNIISGAAVDVFVDEPTQNQKLVDLPNLISTPHLGASTSEAQVEVALEVVQEVLDVLDGKFAKSTVNLPFLPDEAQKVLTPYFKTAELLGEIITQLSEGQFKSLKIIYNGDLSQYDTNTLKSSVLVGLLNASSDEKVNIISSPFIAQNRGLHIIEEKNPSSDLFSSVLSLELTTEKGQFSISGVNIENETHIVKVNDRSLDFTPYTPYLLFIENLDRPGTIGKVGTVAGEYDINIAFMTVGRNAPRDTAIMIVGIDDAPNTEVIESMRKIKNIVSVKGVSLDIS